MSNEASSVSTSTSSTAASHAAAAQAVSNAPKTPTAASSSSEVAVNTMIKSLENLRALDPTMYQQFMMAIAQNMMTDFKRKEDILEADMKKMAQDG